jgi:transcriptional regulator with XRE-family HTH domain
VTPTAKDRRPGDPIPPEIVREFRTLNRLTQEQLAERLGIRGGKPVISGWETGRASCEGPAAEFLLYLMGRGNVAFSTAALRLAMNAEWERTGQPIRRWRQVGVVPESAIDIEAPTFVKLFPDAAIENGWHGFPFARGYLQDCIGIRPDAWVGVIPPGREAQPTYLWMLRRDLSFAYRSKFWEDDPSSVTSGRHIDVGYELLHAAQTALLLRRIARPAPAELRFTFYLDLAGVRGHGLIDATQPLLGGAPLTTWAEDEAHASLSVSADEVFNDPLGVSSRLVIELASQLGDEFASEAALRRVVQHRKKEGTVRDFIHLLRALGSKPGEK